MTMRISFPPTVLFHERRHRPQPAQFHAEAPWGKSVAPAPLDSGAARPLGSSNVTVVPAPTAVRIETDPPDWRAKPYTMLSPRPVPLPASLVVKNGSNARAATSGGIPIPVSEIAKPTNSPSFLGSCGTATPGEAALKVRMTS